MTYTEPQLTNVGAATELIASPIDKNTVASDGGKAGTPAYDLDE